MLFDNLKKGVTLSLPECHKCGLYKNCGSPKMAPYGSGKRRILFIGEAPGKDEDDLGQPFVGMSGQYLRKILRCMRCDLDECTVTNSIICRPPNNKMDPKYHVACAPNLRKLLKEESFDVIITLGEWALKQVIPDAIIRYGGGIGKWRGWKIPLLKLGCYLCPTYHPSYIIRTGEDPIIAREFRTDLESALDQEMAHPAGLESPTYGMFDLDQLKTKIEIVKSPRKRMEDLARRSGILAFDYETTGLKPDADHHRIVSCSFCLDGEDTWACMIADEDLPNLGRILFSKKLKKVASNLKFEERWTIAKFGRGVVGWHWDTMLAAHVLDNRSGITSIKFQSFVRLGIGGWEDGVKDRLRAKGSNDLNKVDKISDHDLLIYNGLDSLLEWMVMEDQKREMSSV